MPLLFNFDELSGPTGLFEQRLHHIVSILCQYTLPSYPTPPQWRSQGERPSPLVSEKNFSSKESPLCFFLDFENFWKNYHFLQFFHQKCLFLVKMRCCGQKWQFLTPQKCDFWKRITALPVNFWVVSIFSTILVRRDNWIFAPTQYDNQLGN